MSGWVVRKKFQGRNIEKLKKMAQNIIKLPLTQKYRYVFVRRNARLARRFSRHFSRWSYPIRIGIPRTLPQWTLRN